MALRISSMIYYFFPRAYINFTKDIIQISSVSNQKISPSLQQSLQTLITQIENCSEWNKYASFFYNPYVWIYTPNEKKTISKLSIIDSQTNSLYFYEMIEIYHLMSLNWTMKQIKTLHLGKNGFMVAQAVSFLRGHNSEDSIKVFLTPSLKEDSLKHFISVDATHSTKDSILDICVALCVQKQSGTLMMKVGDTFSSIMLDILYLISHFYEKTYFIKPIITDVTKSDKFIICKGFLYETNPELEGIHKLFHKIFEYTNPIHRIFNFPIPLFYISKLEEINSIFGQPQLEHIQVILNRIQTNHFKPPDINQIPRIDIQKCIEWCMKYHVPFVA